MNNENEIKKILWVFFDIRFVLFLLLFIVYTNDLPDSVESQCKLNAEDIKLITTVRNSIEGIEIKKYWIISNWTKDFLLRLNASKWKVMHLGNSNPIQAYDVKSVSTC